MRVAVVALSLMLCGLFSSASAQSDWRGRSNEFACGESVLKVYDNKSYNRERGAYDYLPYAIASLNAYDVEDIAGFALSRFDVRWKRGGRIEKDSGLLADYYFFSDADRLSVIVAFRGTRASSFKDWFSNASWVTGLLPFRNHYDDARDAFATIRDEAVKIAKGRELSFVATGHSLGGGLAQHVAFAFSCVSAAVFDTSCVTNQSRLPKTHNPVIVSIHEDGDELTRGCNAVFSSTETATYRHYPVNTIKAASFQHSITPFAVGMARTVADCQFEQRIGKRSCALPRSDARARRLYCETWGRHGPDRICLGWAS